MAKAIFAIVYDSYSSDSDYVYIIDDYSYSVEDGDSVYTYPVVFEDGSVGYLKSEDRNAKAETVYAYSVDSDGYAEFEDNDSDVVNGVYVNYVGNRTLGLSQYAEASVWTNEDIGSVPVASDAAIWNVEDADAESADSVYADSISKYARVALVLDEDQVQTAFIIEILTEEDVAEPELFTVSFDANGAEGSVAAVKQTAEGGTVTIPGADGLTYAGYSFKGWNTKTDGTGTTVSGTYAPTADTTLYAIWDANTVGGTVEAAESSSFTVTSGANFTGKKGEETITVTLTKTSGNFASEASLTVAGIDGAEIAFAGEAEDAGTDTTVDVVITLPAQSSITADMAEGQTLTITLES